MSASGADFTRVARVQTVDDTGDWPRPAGRVFRCQVYVYPKGEQAFLAVAAAIPGVAGTGTSEDEALTDIVRAFKAVLPFFTQGGGKVPWLQTPPEPGPGGLVRWVFPEIV